MMDVVLAALVLAVVLFAPLARYAADRLPLADEDREILAVDGLRGEGGDSLPVQDLPVGAPPAGSVSSPASILSLAGLALGQSGADELLTILDATDLDDRLSDSAVLSGNDGVSYPYRYPAMFGSLKVRLRVGEPRRGPPWGQPWSRCRHGLALMQSRTLPRRRTQCLTRPAPAVTAPRN